MPHLVKPFSKALSYASGSSSSLLLRLAEEAVDALISWHDRLPHSHLRELMTALIPKLKAFMNETKSEVIDSSESDTKKSGKPRQQHLPISR